MNLSGEIAAMMAELENVRKTYQHVLDQLGRRELTEEERIAKENLESLLDKAEVFKQSCPQQEEAQITRCESEIDEESEVEMFIAMAIGDVIGEMPDDTPLGLKKKYFEASSDVITRIRQLLSVDKNRKVVQDICQKVLQELKPTEAKNSSFLLPSLLEMLCEGQVNTNDAFMAGAGAFGERNLLSTFLAPLVSIHLANHINKEDVSQADLDQIVELTGFQGSEKYLARILKKIQNGLESYE